MTEVCDDCMFWKPLRTVAGQCRRYPPWVECSDKSSWPVTYRTDGCGEWKGKGDMT